MSAEVVTHPAIAAEDRRRWLALAVIVTAQFMVVLDISIVNVALPSMVRDPRRPRCCGCWVGAARAPAEELAASRLTNDG